MDKKRKVKLNMMLDNKHYKNLQLILYFLTVLVITAIYILLVFLFSTAPQIYLLTGLISLLIGSYVAYNRDDLLKKLSNKVYDIKRQKIKKDNKDGLKRTISKIGTKKRNLKLKIGEKNTLKEKINNFKEKIKNKNKPKKDYVEIK